jgi:cyanate permease
MFDQMSPTRGNPTEMLRWTAIAFVVGWGIHALDHLRRGMSASPPFIMAAGMIQGVLVAVAVIMALTRHRRAPEAAIVVGFASAVGFSYAHLLPTFIPGYQDSFISPPHINVTWFSWFSALAEIGTGIVFALAGIRAQRSVAVALATPLPGRQEAAG